MSDWLDEETMSAVKAERDQLREQIESLRAQVEGLRKALILASNLESVCRDALALSDKHRDAILYGGPLTVALDEYSAALAALPPGALTKAEADNG